MCNFHEMFLKVGDVPSSFQLAWNVDVMVGARAAIPDYEVGSILTDGHDFNR